MNNKAHTILVSVMASYGSRLTTSTANCKAFLADYLSEYAEEKHVLVELHALQLTKALQTFKSGAIDKKTLHEFIEQLDARSQIAMHDLAWGVDAWANAVDIDVKARRAIRKQCFSNAKRDLHLVTIRSIEAAPEAAPEIPAVVVENANQAAFPRMALMGVATLVSTFSIFQAVKSMLPSDTTQVPASIEQAATATEQTVTLPVALEQDTVIAKPESAAVAETTSTNSPLPKLVVIKPSHIETAIEANQLSHHEPSEALTTIDVDKLSGTYVVEETEMNTSHISIDFAAASTEQTAPIIDQEISSPSATETTDALQQRENDKLHADIEAFLTQQQ